MTGTLAAVARDAGLDALSWVRRTVETADGLTLISRSPDPGDDVEDCLYAGTAGYLCACAEASLGGWAPAGSDAHALAQSARDRLIAVAATAVAAGDEPAEPLDVGYYSGLAGELSGLLCWARVAGDAVADGGAGTVAARLRDVAMAGVGGGAGSPELVDIISGSAGIIVALLDEGSDASLAVASRLGDGLLAAAETVGAGLEWHMMPAYSSVLPNFSHGGAGIGFALARAGVLCGRPDLVAAAVAAGRRLVELGDHADGWSVPRYLPAHPDDDAGPSYGWCHGPTGTVQLFLLLDRLQPAAGWDRWVAACLAAVLDSGIPERRHPGFWDNIGRCCGTAGVGELALDRYQATGDRLWLEWADVLASDVLVRRITDADGTRWSHTEHRVDPPELPPLTGHMQGASGIASFLLRFARVHRDGPAAHVLPWPDRVAPID